MRRGLLLVALGFVLLVVQSALATLLPMHAFAPNLVLPIVVYLGVAPDSSLVRGALVSFALGYQLDAFCGHRMGLQTFTLCASFLVARSAAARFVPQGLPFQLFSTFATALLAGATVVALRAIFEHQSVLRVLDDPLRTGMTLLQSSVVTALMSPLVFALVRRIEGASEMRSSPSARVA